MFNLKGQDGVQLKMFRLSHRTWPSFFFGGGGGVMYVQSLKNKTLQPNAEIP